MNLLLRGGAMLLLVLMAASFVRHAPRAMAARLGAAFAVGVSAFIFNTAPGFASSPAWWQAPLVALDAGNMLVFWLFTRALLDDEFVPRWRHLAAWSVLAAAGVLNCLLFSPHDLALARPVGLMLTLATVLFAVLSVAQSLSTWRGDLVEGRRRLRMVIVAAIAGYGIVMALAAIASGDVRQALSSTLNAAGLATLSLLIAWQLLHMAGSELFARQAPGEGTAGAADAERKASAAPASDPGLPEAPDPAALRTLERLMTVERLYREENLSIGSLAVRMEMPEYKLRRLINGGMGYRNFNAFLNAYRIEDAKRALGDAGMDEVPVLNIAMDAGFQSLGPFNRAFKAATGLTPTEFRRARAASGAPCANIMAES